MSSFPTDLSPTPPTPPDDRSDRRSPYSFTPPMPEVTPNHQPRPLTIRGIGCGEEERHPPLTLETWRRLVEFALDQGRRAIRPDATHGEMGAFAELSVIPYEHLAALKATYAGEGKSGYQVYVLGYTWRRAGLFRIWSTE